MSVAFLLLLPVLLSGFVFANTWVGSVYKISREEGYALYFRSAFYGCFIVVISFLLVIYSISSLDHNLNNFAYEQTLLFKVEFHPFVLLLLYTSYLSLLIAYPFAWLLNRTIPHFIRMHFIHDGIAGDDLEELLYKSMQETFTIQVSMKNRKHYIGFVISGYNPEKDSDFVKILPLMSGYRDKDALTFNPTTFYAPVYQSIKQGNFQTSVEFELLLPRSEIDSVGSFDMDAYAKFQEVQSKGSEDLGEVETNEKIEQGTDPKEYRQYREYREYRDYEQ